MEYTIRGNVYDGVGLSREVQQFISDKKKSVLVSLAIEEMVGYILEINDELDWIDIIIRDNDEFSVISIKHSGIGYNPKNKDLNSDNIKMLLGISSSIDYSQILGLNNTAITIEKKL